MLDLGTAILLFFPLFFVVNLVAAVPGRRSLQGALRTGIRNTIVGTLVLFGVCVVCYFLFGWLMSRPPLW